MAELPDLDTILARVHEEAQRPEYQLAQHAQLAPLPVPGPAYATPANGGSAASSTSAATGSPGAGTVPPSSVDAFLLIADQDVFIDQAYQRLLGRPSDTVGAADYRLRLDAGYGRPFVLAALAAAREPGATRAPLADMGLAAFTYNLWRVLRRLGLEEAGRWCNATYGRRRQRLAQQSEAALLARRREMQALTQSIVDLEQCMAHQSEVQQAQGQQLSILTTAQQVLAETGAESNRAAEALRRDLAVLREAQQALAETGAESSQAAEALRRDLAVLREAQQALAETGAESSQAAEALRRDLAILRASARALRLAPPAVERAADRLPGADMLADTANEPADMPATAGEGTLAQRLDAYYFAFEATHRGSEGTIRQRQWPYLEALASLPEQLAGQPVLDLGCGRGEWLGLLREHGFAARGVDLSPTMVACCRDYGLEVTQEDGVSALSHCAAGSLAAVSAFHLIEHLPFSTLFRLLEEAARAIAPGGLLLLETPNPENVLVGSHTFYHDFSHRNPVTPSALDFLVAYFGFEQRQLLRLNPYPPEAQVNESTQVAARVNGHFCGPQDLGLVARKASETA